MQAGHIQIGGRTFFLEPLFGHVPNKRGHHLHVVYEDNEENDHKSSLHCGTSDDWRKEWRSQLRQKLQDAYSRNETKRGLNSSHRYLELLIVCDKQFLNFHKGTDYHNYVLTIMNMVSQNLLPIH